MGIKMDYTIYTGRPEPTGRTEKENRTYDVLEQLKIPFSRVDHEAAATIEDCHEVDQLLKISICKNLFLCNAQKTKFYLLLIAGNKQFKAKSITHQLGTSRLSFAPASYMEEFLSLTPGSVSILGLIHDTQGRVQLLVDRELVKEEYFGCHPCINTTSLRIRTEDLLNKFLPYVKHKPTFVEL